MEAPKAVSLDVDAIYVISLTTATERQELMKSWYPEDVNLQFFLVTRAKNPVQGCFESHQKVLELAKSKGYKRVLVFEDDAYPRYPWKHIVEKTNKVLGELEALKKKWDFLALGYYPYRTKKTDSPDILGIDTTCGTHAYIANIPDLKIYKWNNIAVDRLFFFKRASPYISYATHDILFEQNFNKSQISKLSVHEFGLKGFPKMFGGLEHMRDASTNCHVLVLSAFIISLPLLFILNIIVICTSRKFIVVASGTATSILIIIGLFLLFLL
jgi:hypothetical protein